MVGMIASYQDLFYIILTNTNTVPNRFQQAIIADLNRHLIRRASIKIVQRSQITWLIDYKKFVLIS